MNKALGFLALIIIGAIALGVVGIITTYSVPVNSAGILIDKWHGGFTGPIGGPVTVYFQKAPWQDLVVVSTAVNTVQLESTAGGSYGSVNVLTHDNLNVSVDVTFRYQVGAQNLIPLYQHYTALSWEQDTIIPIIRATVRDVVANYTADEIQTFRPQIQAGVESELTKQLLTEPSLASDIHIVELNIKEIALPTSYLAAIQAKLNAQQSLLQAQFSAEQLVVTALGQRNATIIAAQAQANATVIQANAQGTSVANLIVQIESQTCPTKAVSCMWNATQIAAFTNTYTTLKLLSQLTGQNLYIFIGSPSGGIIVPTATKTGP